MSPERKPSALSTSFRVAERVIGYNAFWESIKNKEGNPLVRAAGQILLPATTGMTPEERASSAKKAYLYNSLSEDLLFLGIPMILLGVMMSLEERGLPTPISPSLTYYLPIIIKGVYNAFVGFENLSR